MALQCLLMGFEYYKRAFKRNLPIPPLWTAFLNLWQLVIFPRRVYSRIN